MSKELTFRAHHAYKTLDGGFLPAFRQGLLDKPVPTPYTFNHLTEADRNYYSDTVGHGLLAQPIFLLRASWIFENLRNLKDIDTISFGSKIDAICRLCAVGNHCSFIPDNNDSFIEDETIEIEGIKSDLHKVHGLDLNHIAAQRVVKIPVNFQGSKQARHVSQLIVKVGALRETIRTLYS